MASSSSSSSSHVGFSIREYTADMRETDITKCWPFGGCGRGRRERTAEVEAEEGESSFLPPIRVVKFRWWFDVVAAARSRKEIDLADVISLGSVVRRGSGLCSARADDDDCTAEAGELRIKKKKKKKRKKKERSIVEIFAVSPLVVVRAKKQARTRSKKKKKMKKKKKRVKGKVKTRCSIMGTRVFEAKKVLKRKIHDERSSTTRIDEESDLKLERKIPSDMGDSVDPLTVKEKWVSKPVCSQKKRKSSESLPNFDAKHQKQDSPENQVRGILKRRSGQDSEIGPIEFKSLITAHDTGEKRVKFTISVSDGERRSDETSADDNDSVGAIVQAVAVDDNDSDSKRNISDCEAIIDAEESPVSSVEENPGKRVEPSANQLEISAESCVRSQISTGLDEPLPAFDDQRTTVAFHGPQYADYSKYLYEVARPIDARANDPIDTSILRYDRHPGRPCPIYSPRPTAMTRAVSELSPAGTLSFLCDSGLPGASPRPSAYHNLRDSSYGFLADGLADNDLLGLPLNSYGELIRVNADGGNPVLRRANISDDCGFPLRGPRDDFRTRMTVSSGASDQLDSFRMLDLGGKDPFSPRVARSHARTDVDYCRHKSGDRASPSSAPLTMRLMGKDVPVSRSSRDTNGSEDASIWTDKAIIMEHRSAECRSRDPYFGWHNGEAWTERFLKCEPPILRHPASVTSPGFCSPGTSFISNARPRCHHVRREPIGFANAQNTCPWISGAFLYPEDKQYSQPSQHPIISGGLASFRNPSTPEHGQASSFQSSNVIPPSISISPASSFYYQPYLDTSTRYDSHTIPANHARNTANSLFRGENSSARPLYMPVLPRPGCNSHNIISRDGMRWNPAEVSGSNPFRNSLQKPAALLVDPEKHLRSLCPQRPFFAGASHSGATSASVEIDFSTGSWGKYVGPRIDNLGPKMSRISSIVGQVKAKEAANPGPTKHILKLSSDTDKASSVPVHSTIPFGGGGVTGFVVVPECEARSTKIFKF